MVKGLSETEGHDLQPYRTAAKTHYLEFSQYLGGHLVPEVSGSRVTAREKLLKLTALQFHELSTDVCDELVRRKNGIVGNEVPFLPPRDDFHPKRNQARQKLSTLPAPRFQLLAGDVHSELSRRYPQL
ncbi:hypothetical protein JAAARDRAFT_59275 [Jaapia argillacea MUCL 33604]|uniref:GIT Spa2 homology (SHD) domain-containing protein n=1 Tax=Jaapia argillacea MUCL 33604 TaxID=933084 RepID=A0A067PNL6_9AGAM|nr:hypothetical protein JAAARDRAFT_59275 [Jaapia argillacea MUCL 33604]